MYFKRTFYSGGSKADAREKKWAEFECGHCGHIKEFEITGRIQDTFDYERDRKCPACGNYNSDNPKKNNEIKLNILKQKENKILNDLLSVRSEIEVLIKSIENNELIIDKDFEKLYK